MKSMYRSLIQTTIVIALLLPLSSCGKTETGFANASAVSYASKGVSNFGGTWAMKFKGVKDGCGLGLKGKSFPGTVVITQKGKKVGLTIVGIAKTFKGSVSGVSLNTTGNYILSGFKLSGTIAAKLTKPTKLKITAATLKINTGKKVCSVSLSGTGSR